MTVATQLRTEGRDALLLLGAGLSCIYVVSAATVAGQSAGAAAFLVGIAAAQAAAVAATRTLQPKPLLATAMFDLALVGMWVLSRTVGLPVGPSGRQPVGILDTLCALDAAVVVVLAFGLARGSSRLLAPLQKGAVLLAVVSVSAFGAGHTHGSPAHAGAPGKTGFHFYCQLL